MLSWLSALRFHASLNALFHVQTGYDVHLQLLRKVVQFFVKLMYFLLCLSDLRRWLRPWLLGLRRSSCRVHDFIY